MQHQVSEMQFQIDSDDAEASIKKKPEVSKAKMNYEY